MDDIPENSTKVDTEGARRNANLSGQRTENSFLDFSGLSVFAFSPDFCGNHFSNLSCNSHRLFFRHNSSKILVNTQSIACVF